MSNSTDIEDVLRSILPKELQGVIPELTSILISITNQSVSREEINKYIQSNPNLAIAIQKLTESDQEITTRDTLLSFGKGSQLGDVAINDITGGSVYKINLNIYQDNGKPTSEKVQKTTISKDFHVPHQVLPSFIAILTIILLFGLFQSFRFSTLNSQDVHTNTSISQIPSPQPTRSFSFNNVQIPLHLIGAYPVFKIITSSTVITFPINPIPVQIPEGYAGGRVILFNSSSESITLSKETIFTAKSTRNEDVLFKILTPVTIPPATTEDNGTQIIASRGQAEVVVISQNPGSQYNAGANTIYKITTESIEFRTNKGFLIVVHDSLDGGDKQRLYAPSAQQIAWIQDEAFNEIFDKGLQELRSQANAYAEGLELMEVRPLRPMTRNSADVEVTMNPRLGEAIDPQDPRVTITIKARFTALAVHPTQPIEQQIVKALERNLASPSQSICANSPIQNVLINNWNWDGTSLTASGSVTC